MLDAGKMHITYLYDVHRRRRGRLVRGGEGAGEEREEGVADESKEPDHLALVVYISHVHDMNQRKGCLARTSGSGHVGGTFFRVPEVVKYLMALAFVLRFYGSARHPARAFSD